ncbi:DNA mismatch repair protein MutS [Candidatus Clavichlamydia salmonicola]|uniref:DNA mismatch repair protein MutS n=1 Tax=Candidatus Clavichlamydia salmonicola TaxID=469812 RepID=UPI0018915881|nr:DNA mismatch repair protein MutS [Candidatus Clavichlamydia salmonicola]MBF5050471.1 DNA mismatch repair protein MutS [Candidatus Clavichlamydia salmonicola]
MVIDLENDTKTTPMMAQWLACKKQAPDAILLFRLGDFYEAFHDDAQLLTSLLDLTLTQRHGIPMSGMPWHASEQYIDRLIGKGYKVAIAEQTAGPEEPKGIMTRSIARFVTPGTIFNSALLSDKKHNFIIALNKVGSFFGLASLDLTTGSLHVMEVESEEDLLNELFQIFPSELVISEKMAIKYNKLLTEIQASFNTVISRQNEWRFDHKTAYNFLSKHFSVKHLEGFGIKGMVSAINAAGALLVYIQEDLAISIQHIKTIRPQSSKEYLILDHISFRNLELIESQKEQDSRFSLLSVLDQTVTPMGGRLMRESLKKPLLSISEITKRQDAIETLIYLNEAHLGLKKSLKEIHDIERLMMKISVGYASPKDLKGLNISLERVMLCAPFLTSLNHNFLMNHYALALSQIQQPIELLNKALADEPPVRISEGNIFKKGYNQELDELYSLITKGEEWLLNYQNKVRLSTGIKSLKINFNKVFGYSIEVTKGQSSLMPDTFVRRQTLTNSERFISEELKIFENKILHAEDQIQVLEITLFKQLCEDIKIFESHILTAASAIAHVDFLCSLAEIAKKHNYCRPTIDNSKILNISNGRHPVVENTVAKCNFIPNDINLDGIQDQIMLITGPNMAGKSTFIRHAALLVIMAQIGSFIPAKSAHIGLVDRIFTRIGSGDDLSRGQSTFMVEMSETANILNNATDRSLVILDEIGRGTGTYDGLAIAWAVIEHLLLIEGQQAKTLFATHYWELTALSENFSSLKNFHAIVNEQNNLISFPYKILPGGANKSYGIQVAQLAGFPLSVISRAKDILKKLEQEKESTHKTKMKKEINPLSQLTLF